MIDKLDAGAIPTMILHHLADGACRTIDDLAASLPLNRRQISDGACKLILRNHLERVEAGCYHLTANGVAAAISGTVIKSGPWRPDTAKVRQRRSDTFRQRLWNAMRMSVTFTIGEIVIAANRGGVDPEGNAGKYLRCLKAAGYVAELPVRQRGTRMTSNGFKRFRLLKDTGPLAPVFRAKKMAIHDYNCGEDVPCGKHL